MASSNRVTSAKRVQYGALPYRLGDSSRTEIMLVTSRANRRWIIPKGWPHKGKAPHRSAAREAFEEAGIIGAISRSSVGSFVYKKRLKDGRFIVCDVEVFPLKVKRQTKKWPESRQRRVRWLPAREAAAAVREPKLRKIIRRLARATG